MSHGIITYGYGKDKPVSPTYERTTQKGNSCKVYICSEFNPDEFGYKPLGWKYKMIWHSWGDTFFHTKEVNTVIDNETIDDVIDEFWEKYGDGRMYIFQDEIVVRA